MKTHTIPMLLLSVFLSCCHTQNNMSKAAKIDYEIAINESFQIELASNPSTGYTWKWANIQSVSIVDSFDHNYVADAPQLTGSGGKEIWKFKGKKSGIDSIKLEYCRAWEPNSPASSKTIIVKVK